MGRARKWTDDDLSAAIAECPSWLKVSERLNISPGGASKVAIVRRAHELNLDVSHLAATAEPPPRTGPTAVRDVFTAKQIGEFATSSDSWTGFRALLGLTGGSGYETAKSLVDKHRIDVTHFRSRTDPAAVERPASVSDDFTAQVDPKHLRFAATGIATSWFMKRGHMVSLPVEPAKYDLVVESAGGLRRVQVKSTTTRLAHGGWHAGIGHRPYESGLSGRKRVAYRLEDVDYLFIVCGGEEDMYLIPIEVTEGATGIVLGKKYEQFRL